MRPASRDEFTIAIICALPFEADAVETLFDETYDRLSQIYEKCERDDNIYVNGRLGHHNVVLCYLPRPGKVSAASVASGLLISYTRVQLALVVGICGGAPYTSRKQDIFLGDVIISDAVVEYDFGRQYPVKFERKTDILENVQSPSREIRTLLAALKSSWSIVDFQKTVSTHYDVLCQKEARWCHPWVSDVLYESSYHHKHYDKNTSLDCPCLEGSSLKNICQQAVETDCNRLGCDASKIRRRRPAATKTKAMVHVGKVASADIVMKSAEHRDQAIQKDGVIGFEMEGAGVWDNIPCIIIKGVCDYADSHKNKAWQNYAAAIGASAAKAFLGYGKAQPTKTGHQSRMLTQQNSDIKDIRSTLKQINSKSQATLLFIWLAILHVRHVLIMIQNRLPKQIGPWAETPAFLEDAHLRRFEIPLSLISTWEDFDLILEHKFRGMPGHQKVKAKSYLLQDSLTHQEIKHTRNFRACFRPGRRILMSIIFRHLQHEESSCPCCHAVNQDSGDAHVICGLCETQYRRIMEVTEEDETVPSSPAKVSHTIPKIKRKASPALDLVEDEIADFKRVQIVATSNSTWDNDLQTPHVPLKTYTDSSPDMTESEDDINEKIRAVLPAPTESLTDMTGSEGDTETENSSHTPSLPTRAEAPLDLLLPTSDISSLRKSIDSEVSRSKTDNHQRQRAERARKRDYLPAPTITSSSSIATTSADSSVDEPGPLGSSFEPQSSYAPPTPPTRSEVVSGVPFPGHDLSSVGGWIGSGSYMYADDRRRRRAERARARPERYQHTVEYE